ncbi:MAG TPA: DUF4912 domain-containing protein [Blastocatellia bacterium]|nr:DUF4912 domain-containing protein [Blastocatellia bacterium]
MFVLRPSSPLRRQEPRRAAEARPIPVDVDAPAIPLPPEPYIDLGLPVPDRYGVDIIRAMLQDPFRVFIYWELRDETLGGLKRLFSPEDAATFQVVLKLIELEGRNEAFFDVWRQGRYWMLVYPDRQYEFEVGVRSPLHGYISLIRSNRVATPRGTVSPVVAAEPEYRMEPAEFKEVLAASGFSAEQALHVTVAAMPGDSLDSAATQEVLARVADPLREALLFVARGGVLTLEMVAALPEPFRSELLKLFAASGADVATAGLMHYLPEILREAIEDEREWIGDHLHPLHIAPRFFAGASESYGFPGEEIQWPGLPRRPSSPALSRW